MWVAQTQHVPEKGLSSRLALGLLLGDKFWAFGIFFLKRVFLYAWGLGLQTTSWIGWLMQTIWFMVNTYFALETGIWKLWLVMQVLDDLWLTPSKTSGHQGLGKLSWLTSPPMHCYTLLLGEFSSSMQLKKSLKTRKLVPCFCWTLLILLFFLLILVCILLL